MPEYMSDREKVKMSHTISGPMCRKKKVTESIVVESNKMPHRITEYMPNRRP
jgi:hypothetical protein